MVCGKRLTAADEVSEKKFGEPRPVGSEAGDPLNKMAAAKRGRVYLTGALARSKFCIIKGKQTAGRMASGLGYDRCSLSITVLLRSGLRELPSAVPIMILWRMLKDD